MFPNIAPKPGLTQLQPRRAVVPTAGLDVHYELTKINLTMNQKGCDKSKTTDEKLSARRIQIF